MNKKVHFIGIGGIGLSALARLLKREGYDVTGSDIQATAITKELESEGIKVTIPHTEEVITNQKIIYSAVIKETNVELKTAINKNLEVYSRKEALKWILANKKVYSVCGAHGKSTTSAILSSILKSSMLIGAISKEFGTNMYYNENSELMVFEADESDASFLNSNPYCSIVTNTEPEHMEYYNYDYDLFYKGYQKFLEVSKKRVISLDDPFLNKFDKDAIRLNPKNDIKNIKNILVDNEPFTEFELQDFGLFKVWGMGDHIALDASLAILASLEELDIEQIRKNLKDYRGIKKRFDILVKEDNFVIIDDYAHHPTEIEVSLNSVNSYKKLIDIDEVVAFWQPHKYSRTIDNIEHFKTCFKGVNKLYLLPVWTAGEEYQELNLDTHLAEFNPIFIDSLQRDENRINIIVDNKIVDTIEEGILIGFGAGNITYQLRPQ
ncbi:MAG: UDP-N-acetylmuramate--alanine ligase (EC [uncultured Campylobacterales bacterium]|uniref:UDP-N-acetylmuramate--L-alanine ligase n=1 Tax=uncultured Campylobacterales bacterium TaxID=352960 RepID=A0A6S6SNM1_9BACT|nr:MAG: UDP-N-acetylmuramate--alanine ligase (EC [uncultured Campylobacterales bacterium]